ncbi:MAG: peptidylprolyl isomerase, partial [Myxococcales bacterium]
MIALLLAAGAVVARAGDEEISAAQLRQRVVATRAAGGDPRPELLVQDLVNEALLAQEAARAGLSGEPAVVAASEAARRKAAGEKLIEGALAEVKVDDALLLALFHASADQVALQLVVLADEAEARASLERLRGGGSFADEAARSVDPECVSNRGEAGTRSRGQLSTRLAEAAFAAEIGALAGPIRLDLGWAVLRVKGRELGDPAAFEARREALHAFAGQQARAQMRFHVVEQLRRQAGAAIDEEFLKSTGTRLSGTPAEMEHAVAVAGARRVRFAEVAAEVQRLFGGQQAGHASGPGVKVEIAWTLLDALLLGDAAIARGLGNDAEVAAAARAAGRDALVREMAARIRAQADPDVEGYYRAHAAAFQRPARHRCAHILVAERAQASRLRERIDRGEAFADLARDYSRDAASAVNGGALGEIPDDRLDALAAAEPDLAAVLRSAPAAAIARSRAGWHLVRCDA